MMPPTPSVSPEDPRPKNLLGSAALFIGIFITSIIIGVLLIAGLMVSYHFRWYIGRAWCFLILWMLRICCGLTYTVEGLENLETRRATIVISNHQSAWESVALWCLLPPHSVVIKRELLLLPVWGWSLLTLKFIIINRKKQRASLRSLLEQGAQRLNNGLWLLVFPEGTRAAPRTVGKFTAGAALLAQQTACPIVPIVHNAGNFWPRYSFNKYPGVIKIRIGLAIETQGRKASDINAETEAWIRKNLQEINA
jgi:1-acyl-sn-glycerol-3-phosphate acyltransferase